MKKLEHMLNAYFIHLKINDICWEKSITNAANRISLETMQLNGSRPIEYVKL